MPVRRSIFLSAAFAALLCVSALAGLAVWSNARQAQSRATALHERDLQIHDALATIRSSVYLTAILTRDYLLDPDTSHALEYIDQFNSLRDKARNSFDVLNRAPQDNEQREAEKLLRTELEGYWDTTRAMFDWTPVEKQAQRNEMLHQRIHRREEILTLAERIGELNTQSSSDERENIAAADSDFRESLGWIAGGALLMGLGISAFTFLRMRTLETQSQAAEAELRMLSVRIRTTQEEERKSLSRELHDQVGQMLTGLRMELAAIARLQSAPDSEALESEIAARVARAKSTVEQTLGIVRNIAMLLRPSMLDDLGLTPALNWLVKEASRASGMNIEAEVTPYVDQLPDAHRTCLYRVVQEGLTNATRHSGARTVGLRVECIGNWVRTTLVDDGKGFEPGSEKRRGLGLLGMEERVRELGGTLRVVSAPGRGTSVEIRLPRPLSAEDTNAENSDGRRSRDREDRIKTPV